MVSHGPLHCLDLYSTTYLFVTLTFLLIEGRKLQNIADCNLLNDYLQLSDSLFTYIYSNKDNNCNK